VTAGAATDGGATAAGLPGLRGAEHVGLTVPDLDAAVDFFCRVIGCAFVFDGGRFADPALMRRQLNVDPAASFRYGFVRCGRGPNLELFEYAAPDQAKMPPRNSDVGGHHLAFYVDDLDAALAHLRAHGVAILGDPVAITEGPAAGSTWIYFLSPWGLQLELVSYPEGKGPPGGPARGLWHPAHPER
jgi:catechol 2,3-dioxygenase-like lactoylglutathione lyase family enzyme